MRIYVEGSEEIHSSSSLAFGVYSVLFGFTRGSISSPLLADTSPGVRTLITAKCMRAHYRYAVYRRVSKGLRGKKGDVSFFPRE